MANKAIYQEIPSSPDLPKLEEEILGYWEKEGIFKQSVGGNARGQHVRANHEPRAEASHPIAEDRSPKQRGSIDEFVFYDGPPFANGLPHYGHLLTSYVKDIFARYQTMKGKRVERRFGWDCHGLPAEMEAEKELRVSGRAAIQNYGIDKFNAHCRESVMKYTHIWEDYVTRAGRWVDFENDYKTMDKDYMESVLWAFKQLYDKGLIYESYRVMPYSWAAETPLSNFETRMDDAYRDKEDKAVTVAFELEEVPACVVGAQQKLNNHLGEDKLEIKKCYLLAWTTTPWTLPSNLALAVKKDLAYQVYFKDNDTAYIANNWFFSANDEELRTKGIYAKIFYGGTGYDSFTDSTFNGSELINLSYKPLFPYFSHLKGGAETSYTVTESGLETERTTMRLLTPNDAAALKNLMSEASVRAQNDMQVTDESIAKMIAAMTEHQQKFGYSEFGVFDKKTSNFIGVAGLMNVGDKTILGYTVSEAASKQGIATELAEAWSSYGLNHLKKSEIFSLCKPENAASLHILKKLGFNYFHDITDPYGKTQQLHRLQKSACFTILDGSDFIEEGSGTGVVHLAPGFGEDDMRVCQKAGIPIVCPVDDSGCYTHEIFDLNDLKLKGLNVVADIRKDEAEPYKEEQLAKYGLANLRIINWLKQHGQLIKQDDFKHPYPFCWRTDKPLIYKAISSWYVEVEKFKDRMVQLNQNINWIPEHIKNGQFGKWLEGARDWSISRNRFWGTPIPVWKSKSGKIKVFGSIAELEKASGQKITDLHRPFIDNIVIKEGGEEYTRVTEVFDCWFESGSMPFAQVHYPFENKDWFETHFPADFIVEYVGQTRGWFYTLMVLSTALFDREPFKNCICHGIILDENGKKLSKKLRNYPDPNDMFNTYGSDAMRFRMISEPIMQGGNLLVSKDGSDIRDTVRLVLKPIFNAAHFFTLYANADGVKATNLLETSFEEIEDGATLGHCCSDPNHHHSHVHAELSSNVMDRYILAKLKSSVMAIEKAMDAYDTPSACREIIQFFEVLNNWYIRRNRDRFWSESQNTEKQSAYDTLYTVLITMTKAAAPLLPMSAEKIYQNLNAH